MVKVKTINRDEEQCTKERSQDLRKVHRNYDPSLHQFERAKELTRALNAAKLERVFAKPFVAALPHDDGVTALARNPRLLNSCVAGSADGQVGASIPSVSDSIKAGLGPSKSHFPHPPHMTVFAHQSAHSQTFCLH